MRETNIEFTYHQYGSYSHVDTVIIEGNVIALPANCKFDVCPMNIHRFVFDKRDYLVLDSKPSFANGSFYNIHNFLLLEFDINKIVSSRFLESRFGLIQFIGDHDQDNKLDFVHLKKISEDDYNVTLTSIENNEKIADIAKLRYIGNDIFEVLSKV